MTTRPHLSLSLSREPSISRSYRSRRTSIGSDQNVFSDDHEPDSPVTIDNEPLTNIPIPRQQYFDDPFSDNHASDTVPTSDVPNFSTNRNSTAKTRLMIDDDPDTNVGGVGRSLSTSSRMTVPRSQSPYRGPTAPSQPYAMYPQMTRASSVASRSTLQPPSESPFVLPRNGPQHPYQLYPQNTVSDEGEDITTRGIPVVGFPRHRFPSSAAGPSTEVGDIVGFDGHVEHLPPYTRYADNTVAKGNMDDINRRRLSHRPSQSSVSPSSSSQPAPASTAVSTTLLVPPTEEFEQGGEEEEAVARKEGWKESWRDKLRRQTRFGIPLWGVITIVLSVLFAGIVGGVVGGVIGNRQGQQQAWAAGAVKTIWLDAVPTTLGPGTSPLPTGRYQIPFNQSHEVHECITDPAYSSAWGCMDIAYIGLTVARTNGVYQAVFEDFSTNTADFRYGPQPPDFNGSSFTLEPMSDKDNSELGVAMFFSVLFDKLSIVPEAALQPGPGKRANVRDIFKRNAEYDGAPLKPSQRPWFCFWNSTINEVFIYLNEAGPTATSSTKHVGEVESTRAWGPWQASTTTYLSPMSSAMALQEVTGLTSASQSATVFQAYNPTPPSPTTTTLPSKRSFDTAQANISNYPKLIKMVEKRKPYSADTVDVEPYCQKMQVLNNMMIVPIASAEKITINEVSYTTSPASGPLPNIPPEEREVIEDLESYCICEWTSN